MNLGRYAKSMLGIMLLVCPATSFSVDIKPTAVTPVGAYARIKATADHTYGHEMRLWQSGNRLIGQVLYWDGNLEGQTGLFTDGMYEPRSGEIQFTVTIIRRDVRPNIQSTATFTGRLVKNTVTGNLKWDGQVAQTRGKAGIESVNLSRSLDSPLEKFANVDSWRKAVSN